MTPRAKVIKNPPIHRGQDFPKRQRLKRMIRQHPPSSAADAPKLVMRKPWHNVYDSQNHAGIVFIISCHDMVTRSYMHEMRQFDTRLAEVNVTHDTACPRRLPPIAQRHYMFQVHPPP